MCLSCGYTGDELQSPESEPLRCPECGEDLYTRPPRSYAELEGLVEPTAVPRPVQPPPPVGRLRFWLGRMLRWWRPRRASRSG